MRKFLDYNGGPGVLSASNILETVSDVEMGVEFGEVPFVIIKILRERFHSRELSRRWRNRSYSRAWHYDLDKAFQAIYTPSKIVLHR